MAVANAGIHGVGLVGYAGHGAVLQGAGSHAAVVGPDGSHIGSVEHGGAVVAQGHPGGIISSAVTHGVVAAHHGYAAPYVAGPVIAAAPVSYGYGIAGDGHEGQYVPSGQEHLYDDGSYRAEHHYAGHEGLYAGLDDGQYHGHDDGHYGHHY